MQIIVDTREQQPFTFLGQNFPGVEVVRDKLDVGDYSLVGFKDRVCIERKSLNDLVGCLTSGRERFGRELKLAKQWDRFHIVVEDSRKALIEGLYRSNMSPKAAVMSVASFEMRLGHPFKFHENGREGAEYWTYAYLLQYWKHREKEYKAMKKLII